MRRHIMLDKNRVVKPLKFLCCATGKKKEQKKKKEMVILKLKIPFSAVFNL